MPTSSRHLLSVTAAGGTLLGLALLVSCSSSGNDRARAGEAGTDDGLSSVETDPPQRHRRHHARGLAMPYFSFAQSLRSRN